MVHLADYYRNSLDLAKEHDIHSIAFPAISTGVYGYPLEDATEIAVKTVAQWLETHADYAMQVLFLLCRVGRDSLEIVEQREG